MEQILANLSGKVRRESFRGRDYLVAPLTLIVPGVLNGSKGPLYYPDDEVAKSPNSWDGMPLVVYHPTLPDGTHVSGREPGILEKQGVGYVYRSHIDNKGRLRAEGWFDIEHTRRINGDVLSSLESGRPIELSTGLFTDNYPAAPNSTHNTPTGARPYSFIARNYRPDHVAILPTQIGACSISDGCGVLVNKDGVTVNEAQAKSLFSRFWEWVTANGIGDIKGSKDKFHRPENYDKIRTLGDGRDLWAGGNDWESGITWVGIHSKGADRESAPEEWTQISHSDCPGCKGSLDATGRTDSKACQEYGKSKVDEWVSSITTNYGHKPCDEYDDEEDERDCYDATANAHPNQPRSKVTGRLKPLGAGTGKGKAHEAAQEGYFGGIAEADESLEEDEEEQEEASETDEPYAANRDWPQSKRDKLPDKDFAGPGESFPITSQADVDAAEHLVGHASDPEAVKRRIVAIAKKRGYTLPAAWQESTENISSESDDMAFKINLSTDLLTNAELGANKEFSTDEERKAAFAAMADAGGGSVSQKEMRAQGGTGPESHTGRGGTESRGGGGTESHTGRGGPESAVGGGRGATSSSGGGAKSALKEAASTASAAAVKRTALVKKAGVNIPGRAAKENRKAWAAHLDAATAHEAAGSHDIAAHHLKAADEHLARAKFHEGTHNVSMTANERSAIVSRLVCNGCSCHSERDSLLTLSDRSLIGLYTANAPNEGGPFKKEMGGGHDDALETDDPEDAADQGTEEDMEDEQGNPIPQKKGMPERGSKVGGGGGGQAYNRSGTQQMTANEWMATAPPEIRSAVANAMEIEKQERLKLVQRLIANVQDPNHRKAIAGRLMAKSIGELRDLTLLVPPPVPQPLYAPQMSTPLFTGAAGGPVGNSGYQVTDNSEDDDMLPLPTINWEEEGYRSSGGRGRRRQEVESED